MSKNRLKELREEKGLTQERMAVMLGVSIGHYNMMENGKRNVSLGFAKMLSSIFGRSIEEIFFDDNIHIERNDEQAAALEPGFRKPKTA